MLRPCNIVRYLGHTEKCPGKDCENLDFPFLINKVMQVISTHETPENSGLQVEYGGNNYGFLESHVQLVADDIDRQYEAGVQKGLQIAAKIADAGCVCVSKDWRIGCCSAKIAVAIKNRISGKDGTRG